MNKELKKLEELLANDRKIIEDNYKEIERLKEENEELKHKLKLINSYVYGCNIDSLGSDKEWYLLGYYLYFGVLLV